MLCGSEIAIAIFDKTSNKSIVYSNVENALLFFETVAATSDTEIYGDCDVLLRLTAIVSAAIFEGKAEVHEERRALGRFQASLPHSDLARCGRNRHAPKNSCILHQEPLQSFQCKGQGKNERTGSGTETAEFREASSGAAKRTHLGHSISVSRAGTDCS